MVSTSIDVVDADRVGAEVLHLLGVELALFRVDEWVVGRKLVCNA